MTNLHEHRRQRGVTLVEVMIAMLVGLILLAGITTLVVNASRSNRDVDAAARQLENGRYAAQTLSQHLQHAGFWGRLYPPGASEMASVPDDLPEACVTPMTAAILEADMAIHIQGENAPTGDPAADCLSDADHVDGTDIVTIRRAANIAHNIATANANANTFYLQTASESFALDTGTNVQAANDGLGITEVDASGVDVPAPLYQYRIDTFYISPRTRPVDATPCDGDTGDTGEAVPTLMHMRLVDAGFCAQAVAVGIEEMQIEYGVDEDFTDLDGIPDKYTAAPADTEEWSGVMSVRLYLLTRSTENVGAAAGKSYTLGEVSPKVVDDPGDGFSRHVFTTTTRLVNPSARLEQP